jgi:hypothetical protein
MVNKGYSVITAIDKTYEAYGQTLSPSNIMDLMVRDKKTGEHVKLQ